MRRKLIKQDAFETIVNSSTTNVGRELLEASSILAKALRKDQLSLHCFNDSTVLFETTDNTYVHASYDISNKDITLNDIEEIVIDQESKKAKARECLSGLMEALLSNDDRQANEQLTSYLDQFDFSEAKKEQEKECGDMPTAKVKKLPPWLKGKKDKPEDETKEDAGKNKKKFNFVKDKLKKEGKKSIAEMYQVAEHILDYVDYVRLGPVFENIVTRKDESENVTDIKIPTIRLRNEGKVLQMDYETLKNKVKHLRSGGKNLSEHQEFIKAICEIRKNNALSDHQATQDMFENVAKIFPEVLYVSQKELTSIVKEALDVAGEKNYDDEVASFIAEGILRTAFDGYKERVIQIMNLAAAPKCDEGTDAYDHFQDIVNVFYKDVDKRFDLEMKAFSDLYESLEKVYQGANRANNHQLKSTTANYLNELASVLNNEVNPDIDLAEEVAQWLMQLIETNLETSTWNVSNKTHWSDNGDHPDMAKKAATGYTPSKDFSGDWGEGNPQVGLDDMNYKTKHASTAKSNSWGNIGGKDTYPTLDNPYVPKPFGDYTMKGEPGIDKTVYTQQGGSWQSKDTWPNLQNPNTPKAETPQTYKMNFGKEKDLVVDK